jgi:parallel beta-helix repeat protein
METKRKSAKVAVSLLALVGLAVFSLFAVGGSLEPGAPPGPTMKTLDEVEPRIPISQSDIPLTISTPGSYYLTEDVNSASTAITVNVNDVTIDLMGYKIVGPDSGTNDGIYMFGRSNVEIRNGTVRDFGRYGIYELGWQFGNGHRIIDIRLVENAQGGINMSGKNHLVKDCTVRNNGGYGIYVSYAGTVIGNTVYKSGGQGIGVGNGCKVADNLVYDNGSTGIRTEYGCLVTGNIVYQNAAHGITTIKGSTITNNTAYANTYHGINADEWCTVVGNTSHTNYRDGICADVGSIVTNNAVNYNNLSNNATNAGINASSECMVKNNVVRDNKQHNIYVSGTNNAIEENLVTGGPDNGINLAGADNFYANNRASDNSSDYANTGDDTNGGGNYSF